MKLTKRAIRSGLVGIAALVVVSIWYFRADPVIRAATHNVEAVRDGDGEALYQVTISDERSCSDLTPEKIHRAWEILIQPLLSRSTFVKADPVELESNKTQASATMWFRSPKGEKWALTMIANRTEDGSKSGLIYPMIADASMVGDDGRIHPNLTSDLALQGLRRYRQRLEAAGIHKVMLGPGTCVTLDQLEAILNK